VNRPVERVADWLTVADALQRIVSSVQVVGGERVPLDAAYGRTLATDVTSSIDHPPWDNSGMDGYATRADDVRSAARDRPVVLRVVDDIPAGGFPSRAIGSGEAARIMTGAPIPEGADGVIRIEHVEERTDGTIAILDAFDAGRNVRPRGEDVRAGSVVLRAGEVLRPASIGVLASIGAADVPVRRRPRVAILSTGDELVELDRFDEVRAGKRIVNSNAPALAAATAAAGCEPVPLGLARDDAHEIRSRLERGRDADAIVTTAGASVGEHDLVKQTLETMGFELHFWRVQMRPGSPFSFGVLRGHDGRAVPVFGLPGNPVSAIVTFEVLVKPALRRMQGRSRIFPPALRVRAAERIGSKRGLVHFLRVRLSRAADGVEEARLTGPQGSGILTSAAYADALLVIPLNSEGLEAGESGMALRLSGPDDAEEGATAWTGS
jgi:molybdopterin molybdotransferase